MQDAEARVIGRGRPIPKRWAILIFLLESLSTTAEVAERQTR